MIKNKKIIACFLAFIILFTNIPFQAIATGITTESKTESRSISESAISGRTEPVPPVNQGAQMETLQNPIIESVTEELQPPMQDTPAEMDEAVISDIENLIKNGQELHAQYSSILQYNDETASARATLSYENSKTTYLDTSYQVPLTYSEVKENPESKERFRGGEMDKNGKVTIIPLFPKSLKITSTN